MKRIKAWVPPFMREPSYVILGLGAFGMVGYTFFKQRTEKKLAHPLVKESILLLQNNDEIVELIGMPITVEPTLGTRARLAEDVGNFSFKARGPRGKVAVEMAAVSAKHKDLGLNKQGKAALVKSGGSIAKDSLRLENADENNYNEYYIPDKDIVEDYFNLSSPDLEEDKQKSIGANDKFWKYEYLFAEVDKDVRILVAPSEKIARDQSPVLERNNLADLKKEFKTRRALLRGAGVAPSTEEQEEFRKIKLMDHYRNVGYIRNYMMIGMIMVALNGYVLFRKYKRFPIIGSSLHTNMERALLKSPVFIDVVGNPTKVYFFETSVGSKINDRANYSFYFMSPSVAGTVFADCEFNEESGVWKVNNLEFETSDKHSNEGKRMKIPGIDFL